MRARRRTQPRTISHDANKHRLANGLMRDRMVGSLTTEQLEDQKLALKRLKATQGGSALGSESADEDLKNIERELERRWSAFIA